MNRSPVPALALLVSALLFPALSGAQAPAGATAKCTDGTYSTAKTTRGMCSGHGGVARRITASTNKSSKATARSTRSSSARTASSPSRTTSRTTARAASRSKATGEVTTRPVAPKAVSPASSASIPTVARPASAPATATAECRDGTYSMSRTHTGACSHHGGVSKWLQ